MGANISIEVSYTYPQVPGVLLLGKQRREFEWEQNDHGGRGGGGGGGTQENNKSIVSVRSPNQKNGWVAGRLTPNEK